MFAVSPGLASAWSGYTYSEGTHVDIVLANLVREGQVIDFYYYDSGEYRSAEVIDVDTSGFGADVGVYDIDSGEYRTFDMD